MEFVSSVFLVCVVVFVTLTWIFPDRFTKYLLSVFGIIGYISLLLHVVLNIIGYEIGMILFAPGAVFEIIFPLNLIINGFNDSVGELNLSNNSESQKEIIKKELIN